MKTKGSIERKKSLMKKINSERARLQCPIQLAKAIFEEAESLLTIKKNVHMELIFPSTEEPPKKTILQEQLKKWFCYEIDKDFHQWAIVALRFLLTGKSIDAKNNDTPTILFDDTDQQWIVAIKKKYILVLRIAAIDWLTIKEELDDNSGVHSKTIRTIVILFISF